MSDCSEQLTVVPQTTEQRSFERWNLKEGSIYYGDTLRVVRGSEELKIRFCGIDAPEKKQAMGIESLNYCRTKMSLFLPIAVSGNIGMMN